MTLDVPAVRVTITKRRTSENTLSQRIRLLSFLLHYTIRLQGCHARYISIRIHHRCQWGMICETLSRHYTDSNTVCMKIPASPGATEGPQVDRDVYDAQCNIGLSHIRSGPRHKCPEENCDDLFQPLTINTT